MPIYVKKCKHRINQIKRLAFSVYITKVIAQETMKDKYTERVHMLRIHKKCYSTRHTIKYK